VRGGRSPWRAGFLALSSYAVLALVIFWPSIRPGRTLVPADVLTQWSPYRELAGGFDADNFAVSDAATQFFPWYRFVAQGMRGDGVPAWNPDVLAGVPVTPNGNVNVQYPGFWLARWMGTFDAYNWFVVIHLVLGAAGVYLFARVTRAGPAGAWVAGLLAFAAGFWVHWSLHLVHLVGMVWLPWALAAAHRVCQRPAAAPVAGLALVAGLWWTGANPQYAYFGTLALLVYCAATIAAARREVRAQRGAQRATWRAALALLAGLGIGAALAAPALVPMLRTSDDILRAREPPASTTNTHLPARHGIRLLVADATGNPADGFIYASTQEFALDSPFVGATTVLLGVAAVASRRRRTAASLAIGVVAVLVLAFVGPVHRVLYEIVPGYDRFRGSARWLGVLPAFALPLAGLGMQAVLDGSDRARRLLIAVAFGAAGVVGVWLGREMLVDSAPHGYLARRAALAVTVIAVVALATRFSRRRPTVFTAVVAACALVEVMATTGRWYPNVAERDAYRGVDVARVATENGGRLIRVGGPRDYPDYFPPDIPLAYGVADSQALSPLFPTDYDRYLQLIDPYGDVAVDINAPPPLSDRRLLTSPLLDALDVRTVLRRDNPVPLERASPGPAVVVATAEPVDEETMWRRVGERSWDPRATAAVVGLDKPVSGGGGRVRLLERHPDDERWSVDAPRGGFLRVSGAYDDGWTARIDGRSAEVLRADGIFRGVVVLPGRHEVTFQYRNRSERDGRRLAAVGFAALVAIVARPHVASRMRRRMLPGGDARHSGVLTGGSS
jgi:hypothetical protein